MLTPQASASESLASQLIAMTWSKQFTSTNPVLDVDSDGGTSYIAALDELFDTWLPSRGWSCTAAAVQPNVGDDMYRWWIEKNIQCIDASFYSHRVAIIADLASTERIGFATWDSGVAADTDAPTLSIASTLGNRIEGSWEFWTSDQDTDSFLILCTGALRGIIGFMPPTGSIFPANTWTTSYPTKNGPVFPSNGEQYWVAATSAGITQLMMDFRTQSYSSNYQPGSIKLNFASVTTSVAPCFLTTTNDISSIVSIRDSSSSNLEDANTMLIDGDYYIAIGISTNKLLLNTGTTDPQL